MTDTRWMIYGANGYTGTLVAEEAVKRDHRPILAGRSEPKLAPLAGRLGLEYLVVGLDDPATLARALKDVALVLNCAGPFTATAMPMLRACLSVGAHYLDITGEIPVFENIFTFDAAAKQRQIALIPGCGFDVIPTDCLAKYVAGQVKDPVELEIAIRSGVSGQSSPGTIKTTIEMAVRGGLERRNGRLAVLPFGQGVRTVRFPRGERTVMPIPWGDLATAYRSTGIPNIITYMGIRKGKARLIRWAAPFVQGLLWIRPLRRLVQRMAGRAARGPSEQVRRNGRAFIWARAADLQDQGVEAWLETPEGYRFTQLAGVRCVEKVLAGSFSGALTPAQAFGADFVLEIEGVRRYDELA